MNALLKSLLISATLLSLSSVPSAYASTIQNEKALIQVCKAAQQANLPRFRAAVKYSGNSIEQLVEGLVCDGQPLLEFASQGKSKTLVAFLEKKSGKTLDSSLLAKK